MLVVFTGLGLGWCVGEREPRLGLKEHPWMNINLGMLEMKSFHQLERNQHIHGSQYQWDAVINLSSCSIKENSGKNKEGESFVEKWPQGYRPISLEKTWQHLVDATWRYRAAELYRLPSTIEIMIKPWRIIKQATYYTLNEQTFKIKRNALKLHMPRWTFIQQTSRPYIKVMPIYTREESDPRVEDAFYRVFVYWARVYVTFFECFLSFFV